MIKVVLFDADNVIINGKRFADVLKNDLGIGEEKTLPFFKGKFIECILGKADLKKELEPHLKEWGWNKSTDDFLDYWFKSEHAINEALLEYIQSLRSKEIRCFLATNQEKYRTEYMLEKMGFSNSFDKVYASAHLGYKKPDLEFFSKLIGELKNVKKEEVLFWDDLSANVDAAKAFGINAEIYKDFEEFKEKMKSYIRA